MAEFRWKRADGDFAVRMDLDSVRGVFQKGVVVEPGCKALLIIDGALADTLGPGEYNESGIVTRLRNFDLTRFATAILVDVGDVELRFNVPSLMTGDPMRLDVDATLVIQVDDPVLFYTNVMKGRDTLSREELVRRFGVEIQNALQEAIGQRSVEELNTDLTLKQQFELAVDNHLRRTFARAGFGFVQFRTLSYRYRGFDPIRGIREEAYLQVTTEEARLTGRKRVFDVFDRDQRQGIFEETRRLEHDSERALLQQRERTRLIRELNPLRVEELKSAEQMEQFLLEVGKSGLIRGEELEDLKRTLREHRDDAESARRFLVRRVDLERELEYERIARVGRAEVELQQWEAEAKLRRAQFELDVAEDRERRLHVRETETADQRAVLDRELASVQNAARKSELVAEIQRRQLETYRIHKELQLALKVRRQLELNMAKLKVREERVRQDVAAERARMEIELGKVRELAGASLEALIAVSGDKQAAMLAELKRLDLAKGLTEEQLLALAAEKNPALVSAFEKKFEGMGRQELELMYDRWMRDKDRSKDEMARTMQEMFNKALDTQRDVSVAATGANRPTVVTGGGLGTTVVGGGVMGEGIFRCTHCGADMRTGGRFCDRCGRAVAGEIAPPPPSSA